MFLSWAKTGDLEPGRDLAHLALHHLLRLAQRLVAGREHKILEHLRVLGVDDLAVDLDRDDLLLAVRHHRDHAPARGGLHRLLGRLRLQLLHLGLELLRLLHDVAEAFHRDSPSSGLRGRTATTSPWNALSAACTAGWFRAPPAPLAAPSLASSSNRRADATWRWTASLISSLLLRSFSISRWNPLAWSASVSTPFSTRTGVACWSTEPSTALRFMTSVTTRSQAASSPAGAGRAGSVATMSAAAASMRGSASAVRLLLPETTAAGGAGIAW